MKKIQSKVLLAAFASLSGVAFADINLYGKVAIGLGNDQFENSTIPSANSIQDYGSYFGIRGTDPVYGQTAVIWQVEQYLDIAAGHSYFNDISGTGMTVPNPSTPNNASGYMNHNTNTLASSETYLGLQGDWGRIRMGNLSNYVRSNMGNTNMFNCANGANCLGLLTRTSRLIQTSVRYDTPTVDGFNAMAMYGFDADGGYAVSAVSPSNNYGAGLNGVYSGSTLAGGIGYANGNWVVNLGTMIWTQVGNYATGASGGTGAVINVNGANQTYNNAYINTLELGYNDPDGLIANFAYQTGSGMGWNNWANSGGTLGVTFNDGYTSQAQMLNTNAQLQTQEFGASLGYHLGSWTPKIGYAYGSNLMVGGNLLDVATGQAKQIADSGYQNVATELDWNITPRTIAFVNYGQAWYGGTLQNVAFGKTKDNNNGTQPGVVNGNNQYLANQTSFGLGFSHTF